MEREVIEHFRFKEIFILNRKKTFISFVPANIIQRISGNKSLTSSCCSKPHQEERAETEILSHSRNTSNFEDEILRRLCNKLLAQKSNKQRFMRNYTTITKLVICGVESSTHQIK